jgi:amino acid transporter
LFIGSGTALANAGPAGALIAYAFVGTLVYSVMVSLGEMCAFLPVTGAFTAYASRFVDPSLGFSMGWIYWWAWASCYALELTASGIIIQYWRPDLSQAIFIGCFWIVITAANFMPVKFYGEIEFYFALIKVITVLGFMIFAICIDAGAGQHGYLGFETWRNPGAFAAYPDVDGGRSTALAKFVGFWSVLIQAGFSYSGTELVAVAAGETYNPRKTIPAAIRKTFFRIIFFFVFTIFFIGLLVPYNNKQLGAGSSGSDATASPLVIAAKLAGVKTLPGIINAVLLCTVLSAANSNVYSASRILVGLAGEGFAPKWFLITKGQVPVYAVAFTSLFGLLGFMNVSSAGSVAFNWLIQISGVAGFIAWACILGSHLAFMRILKAKGISRDTLPYKAMLQPWFTYYGLFFWVLIIITQGFTAFIPWNTSTFFINYISLILFVVLYIGHKAIVRPRFVRPAEADIDSGRKEIDEQVFDEPVPTTIMGKFWAWMS